MLQVYMQNKTILFLPVLICIYSLLQTERAVTINEFAAYSRGRVGVILQGQDSISYWGKCLRVCVSKRECVCVFD